MPSWVSWKGLAQHAAAGLLVTLIVTLTGWLPIVAVLVAFAVGVTHEFDQDAGRPFSDFRPRLDGVPNGWPWNGCLDVAAFVFPALLAWVLH